MLREQLKRRAEVILDRWYEDVLKTYSAEAFKACDILWFEEPIIPDHYRGYAEIAAATGVPLAMGENLHTQQEFELASLSWGHT